MERRLVTILAADAVSYSRLVANDEEAALALFDQCSAAMTDLICKHHGRVFGGAGDSLIAEFPSPVEALRCAVEMQHELALLNEKLAEERRMQFRVGLNLGDAVVEQGVLFGDAVNIASRLEGLADPGGICVSGNLYEQVKHLPHFAFSDLGSRKLKNIHFPVHAYAVQGTDLPRLRRRPVPRIWAAAAAAVLALIVVGVSWKYFPSVLPYKESGPQLASSSQPSIAILPLENLSGDASQEYFCDGLTNDITTDLSKFSNLFVIASNSAFTFKNKPSKVQDIGNALGARYLLEGVVQKTPDRLRINAQLIDASTGHHLWAERYDRQMGDLFAIQDEIVQQIVTALAIKVSAVERQRVSRKETTSMGAYDYYLRGIGVMGDPNKFTVDGNSELRQLFEKAIEIDPNFSRAYAELAYSYVREYWGGWTENPDATLRRAEELAKKALDLNEDFDGHWSLAIVYWNQGEFDKSFIEYETARKLNPNNPDLAADMAEALIYAGEPDKAITQIREAMLHNPQVPYWYWWNLARAYYMAKRYEEAIEAAGKITDPPNDVLLITAASKAQLGDLDAARAEMAQFSKNDPEWSIAKAAERYFRRDSDRQHWLDGLRKAGLKEKAQ
jgi:adenylate cyclase